MRSNDEILESINLLRSQLGMEPKPEQQAPAEDPNDVRARIAALNQKLASTPISRREFIEKRAADASKSNTQTVFEFGEGMLEGIGYIAKQGKDAAVEAFNEMSDGEVSMYGFGRGLADTLNVGARDFWRFAKTLGEAAMDKLGGYTEEEEIEREYKRYVENFNYNTVVREKMLDQVENRAMVDFGANFVDPFMVFPVAKLGTFAARVPLQVAQKTATTAAYAARSKGAVNVAKFAKGAGKAVKAVDKVIDFAGHKLSLPTELAARVGARGTRAVLKGGAYVSGMGLKGVGMAGSAVEKVASLPRKGIAKLAEKVTGATGKGPGTAALTGQVTGAVAGVPGFFELGIAEGIGVLAKKMGKGLGEVATTFAQKGTNKRFLYRLATSDKVSEATRRKAMWAYNHFGTSVGDAAFNMLANGLSLGAINAGLSGLAGEDAKTSGAAFGSGALAGGFIPAGQRGMQGGKGDAARDQGSIDKYMKDKLGMDQRKLFQKLPKPAQLLISTLQESGIGAPGIRLLDAETYLQYLNEERAKKNIAPLTRAPAGHFATQEGVVYLNSDTINKAGDTGVEFVAHEVGHDFIHKALGNDPAMLELILERYKTTAEDPDGTAFYFQFDKKGNGIGDPIYLNKEATQVATDYNRKQAGIGVGRNATKLAQEIGADQFSMAFSKDPNIFKHIHPRVRRYLIDGARRVLTGGAMLEPATGNPLTNTISKQMQQNPAIKRLFTNYAKMRAFELDEKANLAKEGILIEPKKGQQGSDRYVELFGGIGLNLKDAKNLVVTNKGLIRELIRMRDQWKEEPSDGWSVRRGQLEGKTLTNDLRTLFTRSDQWGNVANIIDALQQAIDQRIGIRFGYRSGTRGKYQNPFRLRDVAIYGWQVGPMGGKGRASLKVLGYDQAVVRQNVQVLVDKGYIKDPDKFMQQLAEQGQAALADPEGRINPEGRRENEIMTVAFGLKESSGQVASPGLRELLDSKAVNKSFRSYDVEALAGLTKGDSKAFAFNYDNIRDNYNPFRQTDQNLYAPQLDPKEVQITDRISMRDLADIDELDAKIDRGTFKLLGFKSPKFQNFMTANGEPAFAKKDATGDYIPQKFYHSGYIGTTTPEYMAGETDSAWIPNLNNANDFTPNSDNPNYNAFYISPNKAFAENFILEITKERNPKPIELATNISKVWSYNNPDHVNLVMDAVNEEVFSRISYANPDDHPKTIESRRKKREENKKEVQLGDWRMIESAKAVIKDAGFDAFEVKEGGVVNLGVFDPRDIKLIKDENVVDGMFRFNRTGEVAGTFDPNNPDLRFMPSSEDLDAQIDRGAFKLLDHKAPKLQNFLTAKGTPVFANKDEKGYYKPVIFYHAGYIGTNHHHIYGYEGAKKNKRSWIHKQTRVSDTEAQDAFFVSKDKGFVERFIRNKTFNEGGGFVPAPIEIVTNVSKVWDYNNESHRELLNLTHPVEISQVERGDWEAIEELSGKIKKLGFDAFKVRENGVENLAIFNPNDVKLAKDVNDVRKVEHVPFGYDLNKEYVYTQQGEVAGSFDPNNPDLRFMPASEAGAGKGKQAEAAKLWNEKGTDSPYFKKWFGRSKVVDENGDPLVVYHGTPYGKFNTFMEGDRGMWFADNLKYAEIYKNKGLERFDEDLDYQADLLDEGITRETLDQEKKTFEVFLSIQKPYDMTGFSMTEDMTPRQFQEKIGIDLYSKEYKFLDQEEPAYLLFEENYDRIVNTLKKRGFDGIISREDAPAFGPREALETKSFVPFKAEQIKSATGNRGTFDTQEGNILFMPALEDAKALVEQRGRVAEAAEETFFGKMLPKMLRKVGGQLKPSTRNIREAARRAIEDTEVFLRENPQFADYYNKDMEKVRALLDDAYNGIIDDEMLYYRLTLGLTSPGTSLPANVGDGLNIFNLKKQDGNLDKIKLGESAKGNVVITESPFEISGTTAPTKARALKIVDRLEKEKGGIRQAVEFLEEAIPMNELHKFKQEMGYKGKVGKPGDVKRIVKSATGQDKLIPRMFIFGPKVGAYTLNAIGRHNYNTIDVWEARFIRSYFKGMFSKNTGLPANVDEHALMTRFTEMFQEEYNRMTGQNLETSALQALRWFYMIDTAKKLGYTGASTNETISGYTERYLTKLGLDQGSGGQSNAATNGGVSAQAGPTEQQFFPQPRQLNRVTSRPTSPQVSNRFMMVPAAARAVATSASTLDRFRN
jgi:hypothetical protein